MQQKTKQQNLTAMGISILFSVIITGCGGAPADQPDLGQVSGKVMLDGAPLAQAKVYFQPVEGGRNSTGITDDQGQYKLAYLRDLKGAKIGNHKVRITTFIEPIKGDDGKIEDPGRKEEVPLKYNQNTELEKEVKAGENTIDFELISN